MATSSTVGAEIVFRRSTLDIDPTYKFVTNGHARSTVNVHVIYNISGIFDLKFSVTISWHLAVMS
jgi:hypothetical protein